MATTQYAIINIFDRFGKYQDQIVAMQLLCSIHAVIILLLLFLSITSQSFLGKGPAKLTVHVLLGFASPPFFLELPERN